jgi:hypothetical protein
LTSGTLKALNHIKNKRIAEKSKFHVGAHVLDNLKVLTELYSRLNTAWAQRPRGKWSRDGYEVPGTNPWQVEGEEGLSSKVARRHDEGPSRFPELGNTLTIPLFNRPVIRIFPTAQDAAEDCECVGTLSQAFP